MKNYVLGLDLGISSVGWALMEKDEQGNFIRIVDIGSRIFSEIEDKDGKLENQARRAKRGARRQRRRRQLRLEDARKLFAKYLNVNFEAISFNNYLNPFELKVKGLKEKLSEDELCIALYHYLKYRGFKSNRKSEDKANKETGKLLKYFDNVEKELSENNITATQYLLNQYNLKDKTEQRMHNSSSDYIFNITREMYLQEIDLLLNKQIEFGVISVEFKNEYISLFSRQRDFSEGPDAHSPYRGMDENGQPLSLINKMLGKCQFDGQPRAPKGSFSAEKFVFLSFLNNLSYKLELDAQYQSFSKEEINKIFDLALTKKTLKYKDLFKAIGLDIKNYDIRIKGLETTKKQFTDALKKYKDEHKLNRNLTADELIELKDNLRRQLLDKNVKGLENYHTQKKIIEDAYKINKSHELSDFLKNDENFDKISEILLRYKTDCLIKENCKALGYSEELSDVVATMPDITKTINLSLDICKQVNVYLLEKMTYDKAMEACGYCHSKTTNIEKHKILPSIDECVTLTNEYLKNPVVRHTLVETRKVINAIINKYGDLSEIHLEFARELGKNHKDRKEIRDAQLDNLDNNNRIKEELLFKYPNIFHSIKSINSDAIMKYKMWKEQNQKCAYSNKIIPETILFDKNSTQIDHIMPYSKTYENGYFNKVLVLTEMNQNKRDRLPYEAFGEEGMKTIKDFINDPQVTISEKKKETLLMKKLDSSTDFVERNLNDTKYIARLMKKIIDSILQVKTLVVSGTMTNELKHCYGLADLTHSFISGSDNEYKKPREYFIDRDSIKIAQNFISFELINTKNKSTIISFKVEKITGKDNKNLPNDVQKSNNMIDYFYNHQEELLHFIKGGFSNAYVGQIIEEVTREMRGLKDHNKDDYYDNILCLLLLAQKIIDKDILSKDRDNDLHHALDAALIAVSDQSMVQKITKFHQIKEKMFDSETGELITRPKLEVPYKEFRKELIYRVYERDHDVLVDSLKSLNNYSNEDLDKVHVMYPSKSPVREIKGAFFKETIFGSKDNGKYITKRVDVNKLSLKDGKLNVELYDQNGGNSATYHAIVEWLKMPTNNRPKYPILPQKGNYIKKVLAIESEDKKSRVQISSKENDYSKGFASNESVVRVDLYKSKNNTDDSIYMVPIYYYHLAGKRNNLFTIMWAHGNNGKKYICEKEIDEKYEKICGLYRNSLIKMVMKNGVELLCYSGGVTNGTFEVYSIIGDNYDVLKSGYCSIYKERFQITISTIKSIEIKHIDVLGNII